MGHSQLAARSEPAKSCSQVTFLDTCYGFPATYLPMAPREILQQQTPVSDSPRRLPGSHHAQAPISAIRDARRILVLGSSGSGKTHFSMRLAEILGLDVLHLDAYFWRSDAQPRAEDEWREIVASLVQRDAWIMDGTYERSLDLRIPHADAIILLEHPPEHCLDRVIERQRSADRSRPDLPDGYVDRLDNNHRLYVWRYPEVTRPAVLESIERHGPETPVLTLAAPEAIDPFLTRLAQMGTSWLPPSPLPREYSIGL